MLKQMDKKIFTILHCLKILFILSYTFLFMDNLVICMHLWGASISNTNSLVFMVIFFLAAGNEDTRDVKFYRETKGTVP